MILATFLYRIQGLSTRRTNETEPMKLFRPVHQVIWCVFSHSMSVVKLLTHFSQSYVFPLSLGFGSDNRTSCILVVDVTH